MTILVVGRVIAGEVEGRFLRSVDSRAEALLPQVGIKADSGETPHAYCGGECRKERWSCYLWHSCGRRCGRGVERRTMDDGRWMNRTRELEKLDLMTFPHIVQIVQVMQCNIRDAS